ncbi:t-SNARE, partial [Parasponia andersonii]
HKTRLQIGQLVKDTSSKLKQACEIDQHTQISTAKKIADAKLAKDFQSVLKEFQKAQRLAAERETAYAPYVPKEVLPTSYSVPEPEISSSRSHEQQILLLESKRVYTHRETVACRGEVLLLDNEIVFNEAIIEEREQGIQEIQQQIGEVKEIFKDLAVLVHDQGGIINEIEFNIDNSHAATTQATVQLAKASKLQKSSSSLTCLLLLIFGIILLIVIIIVVA